MIGDRHTTLIKWTRHPADDDTMVWVDIKKLDEAWSTDRYYIGPNGVGDNQPHKPDRVRAFLAEFNTAWMPWIAFHEEDGSVGFSDGRHRFVWVRDHGAISIPVTVDPDFAALIRERFPAAIEECRVWSDALYRE